MYLEFQLKDKNFGFGVQEKIKLCGQIHLLVLMKKKEVKIFKISTYL